VERGRREASNITRSDVPEGCIDRQSSLASVERERNILRHTSPVRLSVLRGRRWKINTIKRASDEGTMSHTPPFSIL
jgi:hypothetical protein